jgi:hypothetical protein
MQILHVVKEPCLNHKELMLSFLGRCIRRVTLRPDPDEKKGGDLRRMH